MAPGQAHRNIPKVGRQLSVPKDEKTRPDTNTESKHPLPSPTSTAPGTEACHDRGRKRKRTQEPQEPQEPPDCVPAKRRQDEQRCHSIPLLSTNLNKAARGEKRRHSSLPDINDPHTSKRPRLSQVIHKPATLQDYDPIGYWAENRVWPKDYIQRGALMSEATSNKRKSESTHRSDRLERLAENGVFMKSSSLIQKSSKDLCHDLMKGDRLPNQHSPFPPDQLSNVLERVQGLNEGRVQRDVTPWVVPSAELLFFCGELDVNNIGDEVNAEWTRCATLGSTRPKPDYTAGLLLSAFTKDEIQKLRNYASPSRPVFFTPNLCFPFLVCEVKTGEQGLNKADRQNIHSASIAVKAVIELFKAAFGSGSERVKSLYGQVLVFTVSHDNDRVCLYGHYAVATGEADKLQFYRYQVALISLSAKDGADRFVAYNFVRNVYDKFAPSHWRRIQDASALLPGVQERTNLSFSASELALEDAPSQFNSQDTQSQDDSDFKLPRLPASALNKKEVIRLRDQMEQQKEQHKEQIELQRSNAKVLQEQMERQMERQQEQMERQMDQQRKQMERQMDQQREQMERQMDQQREQLAQQKELISLLKKQGDERVP